MLLKMHFASLKWHVFLSNDERFIQRVCQSRSGSRACPPAPWTSPCSAASSRNWKKMKYLEDPLKYMTRNLLCLYWLKTLMFWSQRLTCKRSTLGGTSWTWQWCIVPQWACCSRRRSSSWTASSSSSSSSSSSWLTWTACCSTPRCRASHPSLGSL